MAAPEINAIRFRPTIDAPLTYGWADCALGSVLLASIGPRVCHLSFTAQGDTRPLEKRWQDRKWGHSDGHARTLLAKVKQGQALPLLLRGSDFQLAVWEALLTLAPGSTCSYSDLAAQLGRPEAVRAVAAAVAANPILWLVPCHRVLPKDGSLGGYAAGPAIKEQLLKGEGAR